jgi:hypothetical protein
MHNVFWTDAEEADLRELYPTVKNCELADALNERHGNGRNARSVGQHARQLGLRKADGYRHQVQRKFWNDERREWFVSFVPGHTEPEISAEHERIFGTPLTEGQIGGAKFAFGVRSGTTGGRFEKGHESWNKGKSWDEFMPAESQERCRTTCYAKGNMPHNALDKPIGFERVDQDGYTWVKVAERPSRQDCNDNWRPKHHLVWEEAHGEPVPEGANIIFANHDRGDFRPENIVAVPRSTWGVIVRCHLEYYDADSLAACMKIAELKRCIRAAEAACRKRD